MCVASCRLRFKGSRGLVWVGFGFFKRATVVWGGFSAASEVADSGTGTGRGGGVVSDLLLLCERER